MLTIYLLRHAAVQSDGVRRYIGSSDLPLSEQGRAQAEALGAHFADHTISAIYHSPLQRARDTAQAIALGKLPLIACPQLSEIDLGDWEGLPFATVRQQYPEAYAERGRDIANFRTPSGESFADCQRRALRAWQEITARHTAQNIIIVAHQGLNRCLLSALQGRDLSDLFDIPQSYACINTIEKQGDSYVVTKLNEVLNTV